MKPRKEKALHALLSERSLAAAAEAAGIGERTLREYLKDPEFQKAYDSATDEMTQEAARRIAQLYGDSIETLRTAMRGEAVLPRDRLYAARIALEYGLRYTEIATVLKRLEALEGWRDEIERD